jgi:hypothetical protein
MKHVIAIPELAQRLGVDARTVEELARDAGRGPTRGRHRSRRSPEPMRGIGQITVEEFYKGLDAAKDQGLTIYRRRAGARQLRGLASLSG